ncbi:MAG TPA: 2-oxo acid dehydrogenase subunit E2 [Candidatus Dormibacteraeota bacterium]|nr:2-oxo acid dehydrogenase subunit E2 [Candidatus Dormibacteraeota bacterium]
MRPASPSSRPLPAVEGYDYALFGEVEVRPLSSMRKVIGQRMWAAWVNVPHVAQFDEADLTALEALRQRLKPEAEAQGVKLTILAFIIKACALALRAFPEFNASLDESGENLILKKYCHIGFAADTPAGLVVPVIRDADKKGPLELAEAIAGLAERARTGRLAFSDLEGGCFSVSNLGALGGTGFTPTINAPEVAVLGVGRADRKVVDRDGAIVSRLMLPLTLVYDHRVVDGAAGGRFMEFLRKQLGEAAALAT